MAIDFFQFKTSKPLSSCVAAAELDPVKSRIGFYHRSRGKRERQQ